LLTAFGAKCMKLQVTRQSPGEKREKERVPPGD
jgi:hypothetical protein